MDHGSLFLCRFVGLMDQEEASAKLQLATAVDGSFLVRESKKRAGEMCLVVKADNIVRHLKIDVEKVVNAKIIIFFYYFLTHMIFVVPLGRIFPREKLEQELS